MTAQIHSIFEDSLLSFLVGYSKKFANIALRFCHHKFMKNPLLPKLINLDPNVFIDSRVVLLIVNLDGSLI